MDKTQLLELKPTELVDIIYKLMEERENLIKYIEDRIKKVRENTCDSKGLDDIKLFNYMSDLMLSIYTDLLERINNGKYK